MAVEILKTCSECGEVKPLDSFYRHLRSKDKHQSCCKVCQNGRCYRSGAVPRYQKRNAHKIRAKLLAEKAVKDGLIIMQPCEVCGATKVEMHHEDYGKPYEVNFLCCLHHNARHMVIRREIRNALKALRGASEGRVWDGVVV